MPCSAAHPCLFENVGAVPQTDGMDLSTLLYVAITLLCALGGGWAGVVIGRRFGTADALAVQAGQPRLDDAVQPLQHALARVEDYLRSGASDRAAETGALREQVRAMHEAQRSLGQQTSQLVNALRAPTVRGRWGEMQLRRIVESAGMLAHCDFREQDTTSTDDRVMRPDLVVQLTEGRTIIVDAKVPFTGFIEAIDALDDRVRLAKHKAHAQHVRKHLDVLAGKKYPARYDASPEFTVMFLPSDAFLQVALEHQPALLEYGFERDVIMATPSTLLALLRTVAYTWRQDTLSREAHSVLELGREMHARLTTMSSHLSKLGSSLGGAVDRYNDTVGSLERNVLVTARKFAEYGVVRDEITAPALLEKQTRQLRAVD